MPVNLSIKHVPDRIVAELRRRAAAHHRSLQGELLAVLEEAVSPRPLSIKEARAQIESLALRTANNSAKIIRADRDAR